jgi:uracil-DNA glycosylase
VSFIDELTAAEIGATFNFYREGARAGLLRRRLENYLAVRENARFLLVGEAPGYRGARISGLPFTSERQLSGTGPAEATATIVQRVLRELELQEETLCWNAVPTHPGTETANRRPTRAEIEAGRPFLARLAAGRRVLAVGRIAAAAVDGPYARHPSHGGAEAFRAGLLRFAAGGRPVRHFFRDEDLDRKARRDRAPLVRR